MGSDMGVSNVIEINNLKKNYGQVKVVVWYNGGL